MLAFAPPTLASPGKCWPFLARALRRDKNCWPVPILSSKHRYRKTARTAKNCKRATSAPATLIEYKIVGAELAYVRNQGAVLNARREALTLLSPHDGIFVIESPSDFPGRYLSRGDVVAFVVDPARLSLITLVPQGDVDLVRRRTQRVELRTVGDVWKLIQARIEREVPAATQDLPNLALSLAGGGKIGLDPTAGGGEVRTFAPLFQFELALSESSLPSNLGQRVFVRFVHGDEPLAEQWFRPMRQLFLKRFTV